MFEFSKAKIRPKAFMLPAMVSAPFGQFSRIFPTPKSSPIGIDITDSTIKLAQLSQEEKEIRLIAAESCHLPEQITPFSSSWQRWAIDSISKLIANGTFKGKDVVAVLPPAEVYINHIKDASLYKTIAKASSIDTKIQKTVIGKVKQNLPFPPDRAIIKCIPAENDNLMITVTDRTKIDRHLAIYENAGLSIKSIAVWPNAMTNAYIRFFGRRKADIPIVVMLVCIEPEYTNVVICRHKNLLFARTISIGSNHLEREDLLDKLTFELTACRRHLASVNPAAQIERLIFLSSRSADPHITQRFTTIAKQLELPAQLGDCLAAVTIEDPINLGIDRRDCNDSWAIAFGLSLF